MIIRIFKWMLGIFFIGVAGLTAILYFGAYHPRSIEHVPIISPTTTPKLRSGQSLKMMSWNVQYMAGTNYVFWYEGGTDIKPSQEDIQQSTQEVAQVIIRENPDIILLQEVDQGAARSYYKDQIESLLAYLPAEYTSLSSAFYWKAFFVPHPKIWGSVGTKLCVISKYQINGAIRHQLAHIDKKVQNWYDPISFWFEKQFHLKRAVLELSFPLESGENFIVYNTHLTAYPGKGSTVLTRQVSEIKKLLSEKDQGGISWVLGGDLNLLPPGVSSKGLQLTEGEFYNPNSEIKPLFEQYTVFPKPQKGIDPSTQFTYIPNLLLEKVADRTLDYFFVSPGIRLDSAQVLQKNAKNISDHYPIIIQITLPDRE